MKYKIFISSLALALAFTACEDDDWSASDQSREFATMFCQTNNTGVSDENRICHGVEGTNDIQLFWYTVSNVYGYEIRYRMGDVLGADWINDPEQYKESIIIRNADTYEYLVKGLMYSTRYKFAIRTLSSRGLSANPSDDELRSNPYNSNWYGVGDGSHQANICLVKTKDRYRTPVVISRQIPDETSVNINVNLKVKDTDPSNPNYKKSVAKSVDIFYSFATLSSNGEDSIYRADYITVQDGTELVKTVQIPDDIKSSGIGVVAINGLTPNTMYTIKIWNNTDELTAEGNALTEGDRPYNTVMVRTHGGTTDPIVITGGYDRSDTIYDLSRLSADATADTKTNLQLLESAAKRLDAKRVDHIFSSFMDDVELPEGQIFELEAGKAYYFNSTVSISKGFTLRGQDPNNRSKVYMGIGHTLTGVKTCNLAFGRDPVEGEDGEISIEDIVFENIDFICDEGYAGERSTYVNTQNGWAIPKDASGNRLGTGNYLFNSASNDAMAFELESIQFSNCSFTGFNRGWVRVKSLVKNVFRKFYVDKCQFNALGCYTFPSFGGYPMISFNESTYTPETNPFQDFRFTNNVVVDFSNVIFGVAKYKEFEPRWTLDVSNNVFVNPAMYTGSAIFNFSASIPTEGIDLKVANNLFVLSRAGDEDVDRPLKATGISINKNSLGDNCTFRIYNNYSTARYGAADPTADDSFFTNASGAFTSSNCAGNDFVVLDDDLMPNDSEDAIVRVLTSAGKALYAEDVFTDPCPRGKVTLDANGSITDAGYENVDYLMRTYNFDGFKLKDASLVPSGVGPDWIR